MILIDPRIFLRLQPFPVQEAFKMDVLEVAQMYQMYQMFQRLTRIQQRQPKPKRLWQRNHWARREIDWGNKAGVLCFTDRLKLWGKIIEFKWKKVIKFLETPEKEPILRIRNTGQNAIC